MSLNSFGRAQLIRLLTEKMGLNKQASTQMLESILKTVINSLSDGQSIKIPGFGTFLVREKSTRPGRNPRNGKDVKVSARRVVTLRPSPLFRKKIENDDML